MSLPDKKQRKSEGGGKKSGCGAGGGGGYGAGDKPSSGKKRKSTDKSSRKVRRANMDRACTDRLAAKPASSLVVCFLLLKDCLANFFWCVLLFLLAHPTQVVPGQIDAYIGRKVQRFWPPSPGGTGGGWFEGAISDYNPVAGEHCVVYDMGTNDESWEW